MTPIFAAGSCPLEGMGFWVLCIREALRTMMLAEGSTFDGPTNEANVVRSTPAEGVAPE
jgi:hypothetical protein